MKIVIIISDKDWQGAEPGVERSQWGWWLRTLSGVPPGRIGNILIDWLIDMIRLDQIIILSEQNDISIWIIGWSYLMTGTHQSTSVADKAKPGCPDVLGDSCVERVPQENLRCIVKYNSLNWSQEIRKITRLHLSSLSLVMMLIIRIITLTEDRLSFA